MIRLKTIGDAIELLDARNIEIGLIWDAPGVEGCDSANALLAAVENDWEPADVIAIMERQIAGCGQRDSDPVSLVS